MFTNELSGLFIPLIIYGIIVGILLCGVGAGGCVLIHHYKISIEERQSNAVIVTNVVYVTNSISK